MQFHQDGFLPGDPKISRPVERIISPPKKQPLPSEVDVMIVGCGPAGLNLAAQLSKFANISTCIVEQKDDRLLVGQADGIACRTMEVFEAYDFSEQIKQEAYWVNETAFWKPDAATPNHISRSSKVQDVEDDLSEMPHVIINQARVHDAFLDVMRHSVSKLEPHYSRQLLSLEVDHSDDTHPVTLTFERLDSQHLGVIETVKAKYVVGCDGARSTVRKSIGRELIGDSINQAWGVMDVLVVTDFPDIRLKSAIHSSNEGSMLIIPREGGYMVRLYIELDKLSNNERLSKQSITTDYLIAAANRIMKPYQFDVKEIAWWSVYEIGQRLTTAFDDANDDQSPHVFLAGDACHTHSPKAGQGLNTSVNDTWNLGWKLAHVLSGRADKALLQTYSYERQLVAQQLIDFDREFSKMFSAKPKSAEHPDGVDPAEFQRYFTQFGRFTAGTAIHYPVSTLASSGQHQPLASGQTIGMRFHSAKVTRHADAKPLHLGHTMKADGRWHLLAFSGSEAFMGEHCKVKALCQFLQTDPASPIQRFTPNNADIDSIINVQAVFQAPHRDVEVATLHPLLQPKKGRYGLIDYEKVYSAIAEDATNFYDRRGIDKTHGCIIIVRPDQYVAEILPLSDYQGVSDFFEKVLIEPLEH
ncbi:3-hydroxybenzoate 4-monooxygenase [Marinomonas sp. M1K-6]|uniref:Alkyl hydroperoxide reductase subunit F n=1 Tax=Marinomonas profundi TaxID=2726122 RepID=A0A847R0I3_9GAMM|nr:FAD-binding monooxygenase [Marinomonas profundi]NLQ16982.1 3-hydroxybenzoate 4-monooxygenase [Marinomonas profundi]UDV02707.1 FAD-binding monooxygenase [Marinomonas profundi]